jgi:hypothetical protein
VSTRVVTFILVFGDLDQLEVGPACTDGERDVHGARRARRAVLDFHADVPVLGA